jgi:preprotein translocase subunit SecG
MVLAAGNPALTILAMILGVALAVVGVLLAVMVLFQDSKSGGLAGAFGGAAQSPYGEQTSARIVKTTALLGALFGGLIFLLGVVSEIQKPETEKITEELEEETPVGESPPAVTPEGTPAEPTGAEQPTGVEEPAGGEEEPAAGPEEGADATGGEPAPDGQNGEG